MTMEQDMSDIDDMDEKGGTLWRLQMLMSRGYVMPRGDAPHHGKTVLFHPNLGNARVTLFDDGSCQMRSFNGEEVITIPALDHDGFDAFLDNILPANFAQNLFGRSSYLLSMIYIVGAAAFLTWLISAMID